MKNDFGIDHRVEYVAVLNPRVRIKKNLLLVSLTITTNF